ncbi:MAG: lytic murein transglycosylase [Caulobacteraceae bacterium]|nr:lytic murein transglycosylase [Caulobacteraceae bacterium]
MDRRVFLVLAAASVAGSAIAQTPAGVETAAGAPPPGPAPADLLGATGEGYFIDWLNGFYAQALVAGVSRAVLDSALSGLSPDPRVLALDSRQPEFARPVGDYIRSTVSGQRIAIGRENMQAIPELQTIEQVWGVPREILIAIWAMESRFGAQTGDMDVVRSLATLAALGRRRPWAEGELMACLKILGQGDAPRGMLRGSWAGAMGQTQMLPSTYLAYAADGNGDGRRDIWNSAPDALASAANLLGHDGWRRDEGWAREVILPSGFDYGLAEGPADVPYTWAGRGAARADGLAWSAIEAAAPCILLLPAGAQGPAFLALPNHFVIRKYNNSLAYALAVGLLADAFAGAPPVRTPWPPETTLSLNDRLAAQTALASLGYNPGNADGVIGLSTRQALRAWQKARGLPADGYLSADMVRRLRAGAAGAAARAPPAQTLTPS